MYRRSRAALLLVAIAACACGGGGGGGGASGPAGAGSQIAPPAGGSSGAGGGGQTSPGVSVGERVFGHRYWNVYRPHFLAEHYEDGRVCDRITAGQKMFGDNTAFMGDALSCFVFEYQAARLADSLQRIHEILDAYRELDVLDGDLLDGYVVRSDRGPDYTTNWYTRNNEPSGDQMLYTLRGLRDVVDFPGALVHNGVDLKHLARERALLLGVYLKRTRFRLRNQLGQLVRRGDDQRWPAWAFEQGIANVTGLPKSAFETSWDLFGVSIGAGMHEAVTRQFIRGAFAVTIACVSGRAIQVGGLSVNVGCNEFNIGLGGNAAVIAASTDASSPRWFARLVDTNDIVREGNALYAMYARYKFGDRDPALEAVAALFLTAPPTPPTGDNLDPNGWCRSWRWVRDWDDPDRCRNHPEPFATFSGLDYMLCRALASAHGEFPE